ncbi:WD40 repeat-like protein [Fomitiporia mediterranea MF3/22]|uniref:WD40 repeat-like protein n=1 Tax=Fomitiporia mediterranea (strain MF3/22) TaxID=694068 RepID=UPI0004408171|nr:WD40 repeat-like protein [Fomitiporia mediterranea MF3/22]EJD02014.1 WD40 repeat-like protein [Fomitiporia mediterranea MF3/22]
MPDAFFVSNKTRKRKRSLGVKSASSSRKQVNGKGRPEGKAPNTKKRKDEELESDATRSDEDIDDLDLRASESDPNASGDEDELETPAEKRLRLAQVYLDSVKEELAMNAGEVDAAELDREIIASRLKQDVMQHSGRMHRFLAASLYVPDEPLYLRTRGHRQAVTGAVASPSGKYLFTSGKEGSIIRTDLSTGKPVATFYKLKLGGHTEGKGKGKAIADVHGHTDEVLALALSDDEKLLASGGKDKKLIVWDVGKNEWLRSFGGHKDTISGLAFRKGTNQVYTASLDRTLKLFDLSPNVMGYVDTLFGHQDHVVCLDALRAETAVSVGTRDRTARFWKVVDETQLVFRGGGVSKVREVLEGGLEGLDDDEGTHLGKRVEKRYEEGSLECVAMIDESTFVTGGDSGSLSIWTTGKKKPIFTQALAHGMHDTYSETEGVVSTPRWITSIACLRYGDVLASGSWSGQVRLWKIAVDSSNKSRPLSLTLIGELPAPGFVNSVQVLLVPRTATDGWEWLAAKRDKAAGNSSQPNGDSVLATNERHAKESLIVVAGLGREPRLGRWMTLKGDGASNGSRVFVLHQK